MVDDPNYYVSFVIFLFVGVLVSTLTANLQKQIAIARHNEEITAKLYKVSSGFLHLSGTTEIIQYGTKILSDILHREVHIYIVGYHDKINDRFIEWCLENGIPCGMGEVNFSTLNYKYLPIKSNQKLLGVASFACKESDISKEEMLYIKTLLSQITIALERDWLNIEEENNRMQIEREQLKSTLLRSISHDLRTPLTGIALGASFLLDSADKLDIETIKSLLGDICSDASWLSNLVENLLNMTRIQEGRLSVNKKMEVLDDVILEAFERVTKIKEEHSITINKTGDILLVPMDGQLIIQVLVNLLENAIRHTKKNSNILIDALKENEYVILEVSDDGGGISKEKIDKIFDDFFTTAQTNGDKKRGIGLGLSICQSIVKAHDGRITVENNKKGGATFRVVLPLEVTKV
jgi:two-component system sensor histidine kinase KdpD